MFRISLVYLLISTNAAFKFANSSSLLIPIELRESLQKAGMKYIAAQQRIDGMQFWGGRGECQSSGEQKELKPVGSRLYFKLYQALFLFYVPNLRN